MKWFKKSGAKKPTGQDSEHFSIGGMDVTLTIESSSGMIASIELSGGMQSDRDGLSTTIFSVLGKHFDFDYSSGQSSRNSTYLSIRSKAMRSIEGSIEDIRRQPHIPAPTAQNLRTLLGHLSQKLPTQQALHAALRQVGFEIVPDEDFGSAIHRERRHPPGHEGRS